MKESSQTLIRYKSDIDQKFDELQDRMELPAKAQWREARDGRSIRLNRPGGPKYQLEFKDAELRYLKSVGIFVKGMDIFYLAREIVVDHSADLKGRVTVSDYNEEKVLLKPPYKLKYEQIFQEAEGGALYVHRRIESMGEMRFDLRSGELSQAQFSIDPREDEVFQLCDDGKLIFRNRKKGFLQRFFG